MIIFERFPHESAREYAMRTIKYNIIKMELAPGSKINDQKLAEELGISRTPVREALMDLAKVDVIRMYPQRGSVVTPISYQIMRQAHFMRETLECGVVRRCSQVGDASVFDPLQENILLMHLSVQKGIDDKCLKLDEEFHKGLYDAAGVPVVYSLVENMSIHYARAVSMMYYEGKAAKMLYEHQQILDAILSKDADLAAQRMKDHLSADAISKEELQQKYPEYVVD